MKVTSWTNWNDDRYPEIPIELYEEARGIVVSELRKHGYKFTGGYHQYGDYGAPVIDGKYKMTWSQRSWGGVMAAAYPDTVDDYTKWAWVAPEEMVVPGEEVF